MITISERLRQIDEAAMYEAPATTHATATEAADLIDALVAALKLVAGSGKFCCFEDAAWDTVNSALALAAASK